MGVVVGEDGLQRLLLLVRLDSVVFLLLRQVFLDLLDVWIALGRRGEDAGDVQRPEVGIGGQLLGLHGLEQVVILDGVIDRGSGEQGVEAALAGGCVMLGKDRLDHGLRFCQRFAAAWQGLALRLEVVDVEPKDVPSSMAWVIV